MKEKLSDYGWNYNGGKLKVIFQVNELQFPANINSQNAKFPVDFHDNGFHFPYSSVLQSLAQLL